MAMMRTPIFLCYMDDQRVPKRGSLLFRVWWHWSDKMWFGAALWRPICWFSRRGHTDDSYNGCVICRLPKSRWRMG